jgi:hypothetical protein
MLFLNAPSIALTHLDLKKLKEVSIEEGECFL